jgi:3D (Asp-Asp-Asp) domain-containing protein
MKNEKIRLMLFACCVLAAFNISVGMGSESGPHLTTVLEVTAYNVGVPDQTDGKPCLTADGSNACRELAQGIKTCAANFVPLGTRLLIEGFGICTVKDRMQHRFANRVDIAMPAHEKGQANRFGVQNLEVQVLP